MASPFEAIPHFDLTYVKRMTLTEYEKEIQDEERDLLSNDNTNEHNISENGKKLGTEVNITTNESRKNDYEYNGNNVKRERTESEVKQYELRRQALSSRNSAITFSSKYPSYDWLGRELCVLYQIQDHAVAEELGRVAANPQRDRNDTLKSNNTYNNESERSKETNKFARRRSGVRLSGEIVLLDSDQRNDSNVNKKHNDNNYNIINESNVVRPLRQVWEPSHSTSLSAKRSMSSVRYTKSRLEFANNNSEFTIYRDSCANVVTTTTTTTTTTAVPSTSKVKKISLPPPIIERSTSEGNTLTRSRQRARSLPLSTSEKENSDTYPPPSSQSKKMCVEVHAPADNTTNHVTTNTVVCHSEINKSRNNDNNKLCTNICSKEAIEKAIENKQALLSQKEQQQIERKSCFKHESNNIENRMLRPSHAYLREVHGRLTDGNDPIRLTAFRESDVRATKQLFRNTGTTMLLGQSYHSTVHSAANYVQPIASSVYGMRAASVSARKVWPAIEDNYSNYFVHDKLHVVQPNEPLPLLKCHSIVRLHNRIYKLTRFYVSSEVYEALDLTPEANEEQKIKEVDAQETAQLENNVNNDNIVVDDDDDDNEDTEQKTKSCNRVLLYRWRRTNNNSFAVHESHSTREHNLHEGYRASIGLGLCSHDMANVRSYCFATGGITVIDVPTWYVYYPLSSLPLNGPSYCTTLKMMLKVLSTMLARRVVHGSLNSLSDIFIALPTHSSSLQQEKITPHEELSTQTESKRAQHSYLHHNNNNTDINENNVDDRTNNSNNDNNMNLSNKVLPTTITAAALTVTQKATESIVKIENHENVHLPSEANNKSVEVELESAATRKEKTIKMQEQETNVERADINATNYAALLPVIIPVHWERMVDFGMFIDRNVGRNIAYDSEDGSEQPLLTLGYDLATMMKTFLSHPIAMELTSEQHAALQKLIMMTCEATQVANYLVQIQCVMRTLPTNLDALQEIIHIVEESTMA